MNGWRRISAEGVAIVFSILLAFAIQAWWEGRDEAERREAILRGLASDVATTDSLLARSMRYDSFRVEATARMIEIARRAPELSAYRETIDTLVSTAYFRRPLQPATGTLDALLSTGSLEILDNPQLAAMLTAWQSQLDDLAFSHERVVSRINSMDALLQRHVLVENLLWLPFESDYAPPWDIEHTDAWRMLDDTEFRGIVSNLWYDSDGSLNLGRDVARGIDELRTLIDEELAR